MVKKLQPIRVELVDGKAPNGAEYIEYTVKRGQRPFMYFIVQETHEGWWTVYRISPRPDIPVRTLRSVRPGQKGLADCIAQEHVVALCARLAPNQPAPQLR